MQICKAGAATRSVCHQGVQLCKSFSSIRDFAKPGVVILGGFVTFWGCFGVAEPVAAAGEEDDAFLHQTGRRRFVPRPAGGL